MRRSLRVLWVGVGCTQGASCPLIETAIIQVCQKYHLGIAAIAGLATLDRKAKEEGILIYCQQKELPLITFSPDILAQVKVPNPSDLINQRVGTPSVAEAAALCAASSWRRFCRDNHSHNSSLLIVSKQVIKSDQESGIVTIAIAQAKGEIISKVRIGMRTLEIISLNP